MGLAGLLAVLPACSYAPLAPDGTLALPGAGRSQEAMRRSPATPKEKAEVCLATAKEMEQGGHLREATLLLERARQYGAEPADLSHRLAVLYDRQDMTGEARTEFERAIHQKPKDAQLVNDYGYFHLRHDDLPAAEDCFREALKADPACRQAAANLGTVLARQGRCEESYETFAKLVGPAAAHSNLGAILAKQGKTEQAKEHFREASRLDPSLPQPKAFLAYFDRAGEAKPAAGETAADSKATPGDARPTQSRAARSNAAGRKQASS